MNKNKVLKIKLEMFLINQIRKVHSYKYMSNRKSKDLIKYQKYTKNQEIKERQEIKILF